MVTTHTMKYNVVGGTGTGSDRCHQTVRVTMALSLCHRCRPWNTHTHTHSQRCHHAATQGCCHVGKTDVIDTDRYLVCAVLRAIISVLSNSLQPMDCSPPGSSVHGILQARILEWDAIPFSRGSSQPRNRTCSSYVFCIGRWVLYH